MESKLLFIFLFFLNLNLASGQTDDSFVLNVGDLATDFTVEMIDGTQTKLSDLKGKVVLVNFWATWCAPCITEFMSIGDLFDKYNQNEFIFIPISRGEKREIVEEKLDYLNDKGIKFEFGLDPEKIIWNKYAKKYIPKNYLIDQEGKISYISTGFEKNTVKNLSKQIEKLLDNKN